MSSTVSSSSQSDALLLKTVPFIRILLVAVLALSIVGKLIAPDPSLVFMARLGLEGLLGQLAFTGLLGLEALAAGSLIIGGRNPLTYWGVGALFIAFTVVLLLAEYGDIGGSCGCFGKLWESEAGPASILRNVALAGLAFLAAVTVRQSPADNR